MKHFNLFVLLSTVSLGLVALTPPVRPKPVKLVKVWETDSTLRTPESVLYDGNNTLYVANIDGKPDGLDGSGFISKVTLDGKIENLRWTSGLNAPKGMGLHKNRLYVTDIYRLVCINTLTGQAEKTWDGVGKDAFLNDVTVAKDGTVYVSDNRNDKIYRLKDDKWEVWLEGEQLNKPNGVLAVGKNKLMIGSTKIGALRTVDVDTKAITTLADGMAATDGIVPEGKGNYFVSDWNGQLFHVNADGTKEQLMDTRGQKINSADIEYVANKKLLVVPTFYRNTLVAYRVEQ
ncbi:SMP-30/gluconolactonase/LRE family protein [Spirosoma linguale]|uniref:Periplasmic ATP/GTP-binding protein n=1 Tax=Spirosoma linguale (strain ATCC 33905 / DSM 74 / LMG 10896 / Claus 1) TaxID=504472 RepID=D2QE83_SPILD|nr:periplasmic ATP/GTP-binding protein [Spirosoma linguale DSM 74]